MRRRIRADRRATRSRGVPNPARLVTLRSDGRLQTATPIDTETRTVLWCRDAGFHRRGLVGRRGCPAAAPFTSRWPSRCERWSTPRSAPRPTPRPSPRCGDDRRRRRPAARAADRRRVRGADDNIGESLGWGNAVIGIRNALAPRHDPPGRVGPSLGGLRTRSGLKGLRARSWRGVGVDSGSSAGEAASPDRRPRFTGSITVRYVRATGLGHLHAEAIRTRSGASRPVAQATSLTVKASRWRPRACSSRHVGCGTEGLPAACLPLLLTHSQVQPILGVIRVVVAVLTDVDLHPVDLPGESVAGRTVGPAMPVTRCRVPRRRPRRRSIPSGSWRRPARCQPVHRRNRG